MNILFALYNDLDCNSASHVDGVARELCARGLDCVVAVPWGTRGGDRFLPHPYRVVTFAQVLAGPRLFGDGRGPDFVHFWNPREINRKFHEKLAAIWPFKTVIHLEDNEEHIARCLVGPHRYAQAERNVISGEFPEGLSHPVWSRQFMAQADGFSLLIAALADKIPATAPRVVIWPAVDEAIFHPRPRNDALRALSISPETCVLTYHGNTHAANFHEVRSLYLAVALLNRRGVPAKLVRVGSSYIDQPPEYYQWTSEFSQDLGFVADRRRLADILAMADLYVQPGTSDPFNDYRFPSKVPEFFAMGKPVVLPRTNVGLVTRHLVDAYVLDEANGAGICEAVMRLRADRELYERLAGGAQAFAAANFSWRRSADKLAQFYELLAASHRQMARIAA